MALDPVPTPVVWVRLAASLLDSYQSGSPIDMDGPFEPPASWTEAQKRGFFAEFGDFDPLTTRNVICFLRDVFNQVVPEESESVTTLIAWLEGVDEPEPDQPAVPYATFGDPPTSPGGSVHMTLDPAVDPKPVSLTAVYVPGGSVAEADRTPENLIGGSYPQGSAPVDPTATAITIQTTTRPTPGRWDVGVFAEHPDA